MTAVARVLAPAKVNMRLRVLGRRADGYHDLDTLFQAIDLSDEVTVELRPGGIELAVQGADVGPVADNLAKRAAARFAACVGYDGGIAVSLTKLIPAGAGLGGGSSDGAAVLRCLAKLLDISEEDRRVREVGEQLGSDVPFFLSGSTLARGRGRGEILEPMAPLPTADLVLVTPPVHVSTAMAYAALADSRRRTDTGVQRPAPPPASWDDVALHAVNDFQQIVGAMHPQIETAVDALHSNGARFTLMSGSGSSVFGLFAARAEAERVAGELTERLSWPCRAVRTLTDMSTVEVR